MNISISKVSIILAITIAAIALSTPVAYAVQESATDIQYDLYTDTDGLDDIDSLLDSIGDDELDSIDLGDEHRDLYNKEGETGDDLLGNDVEDFGDDLSLDFLYGLGDELVDLDTSIEAPEWVELRNAIMAEDIDMDTDVMWETVEADTETGELHISGIEHRSLFGLFDIELEVSRVLDATGELQSIERPWYSIFSW